MRFKAVMEIYNGNPYILMSVKRANALKKGWKKPMPVIVKINGKPKEGWKINMMPRGDGSFYLYLHGYVREASKTGVGDKVDVDVVFDEDYRSGPIHEMPVWFREALNGNSKARGAWEELIPSRKKEILRYFSWLKSDDAKKRNLEKVMHVLSGKEGRFMARTWKNGK